MTFLERVKASLVEAWRVQIWKLIWLFISNKNYEDLFSLFTFLYPSWQYLQDCSTFSLVPSLLLCLPRAWLDKQQHMLQQIYSCTCADSPNIHVGLLARWLFPPETSKLLDYKASSFKEMLIRAMAITRNSFIQNEKELLAFEKISFSDLVLNGQKNSKDGNNTQTDGEFFFPSPFWKICPYFSLNHEKWEG